MRKKLALLLLLLLPIFLFSEDDPLWQKAEEIVRTSIIIDAHEDTPTTMLREDVSVLRNKDHFDLSRAFMGGLTAPCFAIFTNHKYDNNHPAEFALRELSKVYEFAFQHRDKVLIAYSYKDILRAKREGKLAIIITMENSSPIKDPSQLLLWKRLGLRMAILTHMKTNKYADSSTDKEKWGGLSPEGKEMVKRMNELGILVDVSHLSDKAAAQAIELATLPPVASHSDARALNNVPRNLSDELIKAIAQKDGVIGVNFFPYFLSKKVKEPWEAFWKKARELRKQYGEKANEMIEKERKKLPNADISEVVKHIKYISNLVGVEHVGLGSDFEGISMAPKGLEDVTKFKNLVYELLKEGFTEKQIKMILGENFLRVFKKADEAYLNGGNGAF